MKHILFFLEHLNGQNIKMIFCSWFAHSKLDGAITPCPARYHGRPSAMAFCSTAQPPRGVVRSASS